MATFMHEAAREKSVGRMPLHVWLKELAFQLDSHNSGSSYVLITHQIASEIAREALAYAEETG